mmetsp:Transcript_8924/g.10058  ORF Transcript_8924/g.10058 Transcript_8924/m.10058 type:complete len:215 (+) Transcript_8924:82-726(+)
MFLFFGNRIYDVLRFACLTFIPSPHHLFFNPFYMSANGKNIFDEFGAEAPTTLRGISFFSPLVDTAYKYSRYVSTSEKFALEKSESVNPHVLGAKMVLAPKRCAMSNNSRRRESPVGKSTALNKEKITVQHVSALGAFAASDVFSLDSRIRSTMMSFKVPSEDSMKNVFTSPAKNVVAMCDLEFFAEPGMRKTSALFCCRRDDSDTCIISATRS